MNLPVNEALFSVLFNRPTLYNPYFKIQLPMTLQTYKI